MNSFARFLQLTIILLSGFAAMSLVSYLPYYYSFDMDGIVLQDLMLLQSGQLPAHYVHPGLGMNLLLGWTQWFAQSFSLISNVNIVNLADAVQPMVLMAEQTHFLRHINAVFCILFVVIFWMSFDRFLKKDPISSILLLIIFLLIPALWQYDILMIRTETYSLLFWAFAVFFTIRAANALEPKKILYSLRWAGFFAALSLFTKIQSFFLIALLPLVYLFLKPSDQKIPNSKLFPVKKYVYGFLILGMVAIVLPYPDYITTFRSNWIPNKFFFLFLAILYFIHLQQSEKIKWSILQNQMPLLNDLAGFCKSFIQGASAVLLVVFIMPLNPLTSVINSIFYFKVIFLRQTEYSDVERFFLLSHLQMNPIYFLLFLISILALIFVPSVNQRPRDKKLIGGLIGILLLGHFSIGARDKLQDLIWLQVPIIFVFALAAIKLKPILRWGVAIFIIFIQIFLLSGFKRYQIPQKIAYFDQVNFFVEAYKFKQWDSLMKKKYPTELDFMTGLDFANRWSQWKSNLATNFPHENFTLFNVRPFEKEMRIDLVNPAISYMNTRNMILAVYTPAILKTPINESGCHQLRLDRIEMVGVVYDVRYYGSTELDFKVQWDFEDRVKTREQRGPAPFYYSFQCILSGESLKSSFVVLKPSLDFYKEQN